MSREHDGRISRGSAEGVASALIARSTASTDLVRVRSAGASLTSASAIMDPSANATRTSERVAPTKSRFPEGRADGAHPECAIGRKGPDRGPFRTHFRRVSEPKAYGSCFVSLQEAPHTSARFLLGSLASVQLVFGLPLAAGSRT